MHTNWTTFIGIAVLYLYIYMISILCWFFLVIEIMDIFVLSLPLLSCHVNANLYIHPSIYFLQYHSLGHYPKLIIIGEGWNVDQVVNRKLCLLAQHSLHYNKTVRSVSCQHCINPPDDLMLPSSLTCELDHEILKRLLLRQ